ncbi:hypothetical protein ACFLU5_01440 [Bacteroidota bacterium]
MQNWQFIPPQDLDKLNFTGTVLHQIAQLVTMFGNSYLQHEENDSHNNLGWDYSTNSLISHHHIIPDVYMSFNLDRFCLNIVTKNSQEHVLIEYNTIAQCIDKCRVLLDQAGFNGDDYRSINHFEISSHPYGEDEVIKNPDQEILIIWSNLWSNSFDLFTRIQKVFSGASEVRIWPHHFDVGLLLPLDQDKNGNLKKSLGLGLAIEDSMINEPYYYLSYWSSDDVVLNIPVKLECGGFMPLPDSWHGYAMPLSILTKETDVNNQEEKAINFFKEGIEIIVDELNLSNIRVNGLDRI